jgi:hypothetical protein
MIPFRKGADAGAPVEKRRWLDLGDHRGDLPENAWKMDASGGGYKAVGESHHRDTIAAIVGGTRPEAIKWVCWAALLHERDNPYDANAIGIYVGGELVGHLPRREAAALAPILDRVAAAGRTAYARADIFGGWDRGDGDVGHYSVTIYAGPPEKQVARLDRDLG